MGDGEHGFGSERLESHIIFICRIINFVRDNVKNTFITWIRQPENIGLIAVALFLLILHLVAMGKVEDVIYDENHYVAEANFIRSINGAELDPYWLAVVSRLEMGIETVEDYKDIGYRYHLPVSKLLIALSISVFGDNPYGWRVMPALAGIAAIILFYLICRELTERRWLPLIATSIFAFENMTFVMAGVAMLDVFAYALMMGAFLAYLRGRYALAGVILAVAMMAKIPALFGAGVILVHWILTKGISIRNLTKFFAAMGLTFLLVLPLLDYIAIHELIYPWDRIHFMSEIYADPTLAQAPAQYRTLRKALLPWEWVTSPQSVVIWSHPSYEINPNWTLWGLIIPSMTYMLIESIRRRWHSLGVFSVLWFACIFFPWFAIYWFFDRVSYPFYFLPAIPAVCLAVGYAVFQILSFSAMYSNPVFKWSIRIPAISWMAAHFVMFWLMAPVA